MSGRIVNLKEYRARVAEDRRRHRRIDFASGARFMTGQDEAPCRTINLSCGGALIEATDWPAIGSQVVVVSRELGRVDGEVVRHVPNEGFGLKFQIGPLKRERISELLMVKANAALLGGAAETVVEPPRRHTRYVADDKPVVVECADGRVIPCEILDFSLYGIAVRTGGLRPPLGAWVKVGATHGRVARFIDNGFAIDFAPKPRGG